MSAPQHTVLRLLTRPPGFTIGRVFILAALKLTNAHQKRKVHCEEYGETEAVQEEIAGVAWQLDSSFCLGLLNRTRQRAYTQQALNE